MSFARCKFLEETAPADKFWSCQNLYKSVVMQENEGKMPENTIIKSEPKLLNFYITI